MAPYQDLSGLSTYRSKRKVTPKGITFHHTGSQHTNPQTIDVLNRRGLASNFVMDREGQVAFGTPQGAFAAHMRPSPDKAYSNKNMLGIEVSALDDKDITPGQVEAAKSWAADMGMTYGFDPGKTAFGHGELNAHKQATEGQTITNAVRAQHPQSPEAARMSPQPMAGQFAPDFGMYAQPSLMGLTAQNVAATPVTREQGPFSNLTAPGAMAPAEAGFTPGPAPMPSMTGFAPSFNAFGAPEQAPSAPPSAPMGPMAAAPAPGSLQPNIDKAKQMLAGLPQMEAPQTPSFGAPPAPTQAEMSAAKAALTAGLSAPQSVTTTAMPGLTDTQLGMGPQQAQTTVDPQAQTTFGALAPSMTMAGPAPMAGLGTMPGATAPVSGALAAPTVSAPQQQTQAPATTSMPGAPFGAPPAMSAPQVTVAAPAALAQERQLGPQDQQQTAAPEVSITAGAHSAGDFARAMGQQIAAKNAAVNSAGPETPGGLKGALGKIGSSLGGMFGGGGNNSTGKGSFGGGGPTGGGGGSMGGSKSSGAKSTSSKSSKGSSGKSVGSRNKAR